jgi:hypothetical protein
VWPEQFYIFIAVVWANLLPISWPRDCPAMRVLVGPALLCCRNVWSGKGPTIVGTVSCTVGYAWALFGARGDSESAARHSQSKGGRFMAAGRSLAASSRGIKLKRTRNSGYPSASRWISRFSRPDLRRKSNSKIGLSPFRLTRRFSGSRAGRRSRRLRRARRRWTFTA